MTNEIQSIREALRRRLESARLCPEEGITELSPCGRYRLEVVGYATAELPEYATITVALVRSTATGEVLATVARNDTRYFYAWITRDGHDYLLFPEDLEGQTVIDLTARRVEGFSSPDDGFIWAEFYPSPDKTLLAIVIARFDLPGNDAEFGEWLSASSFSVLDQAGAAFMLELPEHSQPSDE